MYGLGRGQNSVHITDWALLLACSLTLEVSPLLDSIRSDLRIMLEQGGVEQRPPGSRTKWHPAQSNFPSRVLREQASPREMISLTPNPCVSFPFLSFLFHVLFLFFLLSSLFSISSFLSLFLIAYSQTQWFLALLVMLICFCFSQNERCDLRVRSREAERA